MPVCQVLAGARIRAGLDSRCSKVEDDEKSKQIEAVIGIGRVKLGSGAQSGPRTVLGGLRSMVKIAGAVLPGVK